MYHSIDIRYINVPPPNMDDANLQEARKSSRKSIAISNFFLTGSGQNVAVLLPSRSVSENFQEGFFRGCEHGPRSIDLPCIRSMLLGEICLSEITSPYISFRSDNREPSPEFQHQLRRPEFGDPKGSAWKTSPVP